MTTRTIYEQWTDGELSDTEAIQQLCRSLNSLEDSLEPLVETKQIIRTQLSDIVSKQQNYRYEYPGFGTLQITSPTMVVSYDAKALDALVERLMEEGQNDIAEEIVACRKVSGRAGSLMIRRSRTR